MKLICGLGNPGKEYSSTRHNVGFMIIDNYLNGEKLKEKMGGLFLEKTINGEKVIFLKPQSYMNNSGAVVKPYIDYYKIPHKDVLIIRDDLDLELGHTRIKFDSTSGGDNGIKSIINYLGNKDFYQYKIGISNDKLRDTKDYVLGNFSKEERKTLDKIIEASPKIIDRFIDGQTETNENYYYGDEV